MDRQEVDCGTSSAGEVLVADADPRFRALALSTFGCSGFSVHEATSGAEALAAARDRRPGAVVIDVGLPDLSGYEVCRALRDELGPGVAIMFVSGERTEPHDRVAGLLLGADDYLVKPCDPAELVARIRCLMRRVGSAAAGDGSAPPGNGNQTGNGNGHGLTPRELDVLRLLAEGHERQAIAAELVISPKTVGSHLENIFRKLGVRSRVQAVALAYREDLLGTHHG